MKPAGRLYATTRRTTAQVRYLTTDDAARSLGCLGVATITPLEVRAIGAGPGIPEISGAPKSPWVLQPVFADFSICRRRGRGSRCGPVRGRGGVHPAGLGGPGRCESAEYMLLALVAVPAVVTAPA
jgi:hypothetical protein